MGSGVKKYFRKDLSAPGLLKIMYQQFSKISDPRKFNRDVSISLTDHLMSGLAIFGLKCPSLLDYDKKRADVATVQNLRNLYHVNTPPSDTYLRERLDELNPSLLRGAFKKAFSAFQRGKGLEEFEYMDGWMRADFRRWDGAFFIRKGLLPSMLQEGKQNRQGHILPPDVWSMHCSSG